MKWHESPNVQSLKDAITKWLLGLALIWVGAAILHDEGNVVAACIALACGLYMWATWLTSSFVMGERYFYFDIVTGIQLRTIHDGSFWKNVFSEGATSGLRVLSGRGMIMMVLITLTYWSMSTWLWPITMIGYIQPLLLIITKTMSLITIVWFIYWTIDAIWFRRMVKKILGEYG